jgi:hypothetical protein
MFKIHYFATPNFCHKKENHQFFKLLMMIFFSGGRGVVVCYGEQFELFRPFSMQLCGSMQG